MSLTTITLRIDASLPVTAVHRPLESALARIANEQGCYAPTRHIDARGNVTYTVQARPSLRLVNKERA